MCSPSAPDMSGQNRAAESQAALSKEQLAWAKELYADTAPDRANAVQRANAVSDAQLLAQNKQTALTDEYATYNRDTFRPLEQGIVQAATTYDTPERREVEAAKGVADVEQALSTQRSITARNLERSGVNPSSGKALAIQNQAAISGAAMQASAANKARTQVETIGAARKMDAASLGRGLASNQATSAGIALNQGNSSVNNAMQPGAVTAQGAALMNSGYSGAQQGLAASANTYGQITNAQNQSNQASNGIWGALGTVGGMAAKAFIASDENIKEDVSPVNPEEALQAVTDTPVSNWSYKPGSSADDGGKKHTGPMAQDVKKTMGAKVAPNGKKIDLIAMNGINMAAIQSLSKKVNRIAAMIGVAA